MTVEAIASVQGFAEPAPVRALVTNEHSAGAAPTGSFGQAVLQGLQEVNQTLVQANGQLQLLASGQAQSVHQVMIDLERARIQFQTLAQLRNRALEAYQDLMRMQI